MHIRPDKNDDSEPKSQYTETFTIDKVVGITVRAIFRKNQQDVSRGCEDMSLAD